MRTVLWDFDGTLGFREGMWSGCLVEVLDEHQPGHPHCADDFRPSLRVGFPWHTPDVAHPDLQDPDRWWAPVEALLARAYAGVGYDEEQACRLARLARDRYADPHHSWRLFDDTLPTLERLGRAGWRHVILSNHVPELAAIIDALGLGGVIDSVVNSAETGYEKPHAEAFACARRAAGAPDQMWMVGDNPIADVAGAEAAGIPAILVRGDGATLTEAADFISHNRAAARFRR